MNPSSETHLLRTIGFIFMPNSLYVFKSAPPAPPKRILDMKQSFWSLTELLLAVDKVFSKGQLSFVQVAFKSLYYNYMLINSGGDLAFGLTNVNSGTISAGQLINTLSSRVWMGSLGVQRIFLILLTSNRKPVINRTDEGLWLVWTKTCRGMVVLSIELKGGSTLLIF